MALAKKGAAVALNTYLVLIVGIIQVAILSRALGPAGSGEMTLYRQTIVIFATFATLGIPTAMISAIRSKKIEAEQAIQSVFWFLTVISIPVTVVTVGFLLANPGALFDSPSAWMCIAAILWVPSVTLRSVLYSSEIAALKARSMILQEALPPILLAGWYLASWRLGTLTVTSSIVAEAVIIGVFGLVLSFWLTRPWKALNRALKQGADFAFIRSIFLHSVQLLSLSVIQLLNGYISLAILRLALNDFDEVGYFSRGVRLATMAILGVQSLKRLIYANWSGMANDHRARSVESVVNLTFSMALIVGVFVVVAARPLTLLLFGRDFLPAVNVTRISILGVCALMIVRMLQALFDSDGRTYFNLIVLGTGLVVNGVAVIIFAPLWKADGAAWASLLSSLVMVVLAVVIANRRYGVRISRMIVPNPQLFLVTVKNLLSKSSRSTTHG